ncbi:hypothetical protein BOX15_Mlig033932g2 [Macrostomum lignano]|uniref:Exportin-T n=1 Tax=Macrostomum lignano TaxID=282301 RepID=A0A267DHK4_9PLAT|nr:hypothetical protein BOX15_Mlig033932g2 [Macrostomum lignano]
MLVSLVTSQVSRCQHPLVTLRYFETVVRYEKFFVHNTQFVPEVLMSFLDERGLQSSNLMIRSRVSYLLSRFVKCHKHQLRGYTQEILAKLQPLLRPRNVVLPAVSPTGDGSGDFASSLNNNNDDNNNPPLAPSDQMFLFESVALLIVSSGIEPQQKRALFEALLSPLLQQVSRLVADLPLQPDEASQLAYAECAKCNIEFVSRASKAFSVGATMADNGCAEPFAQLTGAFLTALGLPDCVAGRNKICTAVRGYLHRMVICLDAGVLPYIPMAAEQLLRSPDAQDLHDFYALLGQLVPKFKSDLMPFLARLLPPLMQATLSSLGQLDAEPTRDPGAAAPLRKAYLAFLACLCSNRLAEAILCQPADCLKCALASLNSVVAADGALADDAATCRAALGCVKGLATATGDADWPSDIVSRQAFLAEFLLACLRAPMSAGASNSGSNGVDLREAQTALFLSDLASFLVALRETAPNVILQCIQTVISAQAAQELINLIGQCETGNHKPVTNFLKTYYQSIKAA